MTMPSTSRRSLLLAGLGLLVAASPLGLLARHAFAQDLTSAKRAGHLGERIDGYVGVVTREVPREIHQLANEINARRRSEYEAIARRQNAPIDAVALLAGQKLVERASPGEWVMGADGNWRQR